MRESFTTAKPHIAEQFITKLMGKCKETGDVLTFEREHMNACLNKLASDVMVRERQNYEKCVTCTALFVVVQSYFFSQRYSELISATYPALFPRDFCSYSVYYENLLRVKHQLLYQKELEIKHCKDKLQSAKDNTFTEVLPQSPKLAKVAHLVLTTPEYTRLSQ